jgi:hypothetical protein
VLRALALLGLGVGFVIARARHRTRPERIAVPRELTRELPREDAPERVAVAGPRAGASPPRPVDSAPERLADVLPERRTWDVRTKARLERLTDRTRRRRRLIALLVAAVLVLALVVAVPAFIRARDLNRWERCVERTTGATLVSGAPIPAEVVDACGPKPGLHRVPAERRN